MACFKAQVKGGPDAPKPPATASAPEPERWAGVPAPERLPGSRAEMRADGPSGSRAAVPGEESVRGARDAIPVPPAPPAYSRPDHGLTKDMDRTVTAPAPAAEALAPAAPAPMAWAQLKGGIRAKAEAGAGRADAGAPYPGCYSGRRAAPPPAGPRTEDYAYHPDNPFQDVASGPLSTFSIDVDRASYALVRRFLDEGRLPPPDAVRTEELINYFDYHYPGPDGDSPFTLGTELARAPWNPAHPLLRIALKGVDIPVDRLPPARLTFLIDVSGSMDEPDKLPLLKRALGLAIDRLRPEDQVALCVYAGNAGLVLPPTSGARKERIREAVERLEAGGSTAGGAGLRLAYRVAREAFAAGANNRVILATDGDFNVGVSGEGELVRLIEGERRAGVFLTVLGFGRGNYQDAKMEALADHGDGNYAYVDAIDEARKVLVREMGATLTAIAQDVKLQVEFNPAKVSAYRLVGYEDRLLADRDFNDDAKDAGDLGAGHTVTAFYELVPAGEDGAAPGVDPLKYRGGGPAPRQPADYGNEWATVKVRYKAPGGARSRLYARAVGGPAPAFASASGDFRFAAAVAAFGLALRGAPGLGDLGFGDILSWAGEAEGPDPEGYRAEFLRLAARARDLAGARVSRAAE